MRFVFRADASMSIGSGHVMRSSAIAEEAIARGIPSFFVGKISDLTWVSERIRGLGFIQVLENSSEFIPDENEDILIIDSYEIPTDDVFVQLRNWSKVVSIFDELTPDYSCDLRIHPGLTKAWPKRFSGSTLSGPKFVPLRKSIMNSTEHTPKGTLEVLVIGGGSDAYGFVPAVVNLLTQLTQDFHATIFTNSFFSMDLEERFTVSEVGLNLDLIANTADLVFTTASTTSLEFLARGSAVAIGCAVDNQELYYKELSGGDYAAPIGEFLNNKWHLDAELIQELLSSEIFRATLKANSANLIDLNGAKRIVDEILKL
jgi:spore coat polysaccharide biosynthesis predicted glycosyltransferase SpsG